MDVAEAIESPRPAEPELTFQRNRVRLGAERTSRVATGKELEAEGSPIMDDRANDGRGAWMASSAEGMEATNGNTACTTNQFNRSGLWRLSDGAVRVPGMDAQ
jgi:hypothetical protein